MSEKHKFGGRLREMELEASSLESQMDDVLGTARLEDQLAERKRRLGLAEE